MEKPKKRTNSKRISAESSARIIAALGGTSAVAKICHLTPSSVSEWKSEGISRGYFLFLRERFSTLPIMREPEILNF